MTSIKQFSKLYIAVFFPVLYGFISFYLTEYYLVSITVLILGFLIVLFGCFFLLINTLREIALGKLAAARKKYLNKNYQQLKLLFLANPKEAAMFLSVQPSKTKD